MKFEWEGHEFDTQHIKAKKVTAWMAIFEYGGSTWTIPMSDLPPRVEGFFDEAREQN